MTDYKKYAKELIETVAELQKKVLLKHTAAVLEEMHNQLKEQDAEIKRLRTEKRAISVILLRRLKMTDEFMERKSMDNLIPSKFVVGEYMRGGYPVRLDGYTWHFAVFPQEDEAKEYAKYRTAMLHKYNTTDVSKYKEDWHN